MGYDYRIGDCRELFKTVPDGSVRLVVTSPPYNIGKPYGTYKDKIALNDWQELISDVTRKARRILTPDGSFFLNLSPVPPWRLQRDHAAALFGVSDIEGQWILPAEHDHMDV